MTETQRKIKEYQAMLPGLKERVMAVAMLMVVSLTMVVSASFAWITLSRAPEVRSVSTTVAANGNLEIALAPHDGSQPAESAVGDSFAVEGRSITEANLTWGNLVNLSDSSYGLSNIVLRPALLNTSSNLLEQPLKGADYGDDGRVELYYNEDFQFVNWVEEKNGVEAHFELLSKPQYGVRAVSTVQYTYLDNASQQYNVLMKRASGMRDNTENAYKDMIDASEYIDVLAALIGIYMTDGLNDSDSNVGSYMEDTYELMCAFEGVVDGYSEALVALANVQVYNEYGPDTYESHTYTWKTLLEAYNSGTLPSYISMSSLKEYLSICNTIDEVLYGTDDTKDDCFQDFYNRVKNDSSAVVNMSELSSSINRLVNIGSCKIIYKGTEYTVSGLTNDKSTAVSIVMSGDKVTAVIASGVLKDFEQLTGCRMCAYGVEVSAKYIFNVTITAETITTAAKDPYTWDKDVAITEEAAAGNKGNYTAVAEDTYGMAIDFWVRTNAADSYLTLEGNVLTKTEQVRATGTDINGNTVELYSVTITATVTNADTGEEETVEESVAAYYDADGVLRNAISHSEIDTENESVGDIRERYEDVVTVIGYEGENRIWKDNEQLDISSTSQGSGSCYVFYAEDPAQQENCLRLLSNLRVAFVDNNEGSDTYGRVVGLGKLDADSAYEENGKVTIPLVLTNDGSSYLTKNGDELAILPLEQNTAARITAVVYLDGREMSNSDVLAANDIHGQLNIQFGSSETLVAIGNETLEMATRSISAVASATADSFPGTNSVISFSYDDEDPLTVYVKLTVDGEQPSNVTAFFMRKVNATQGSREEVFSLTKADDGYWYGNYTFDAPGEYVLRTVQLDGVDYDLPADNYPQVKIDGFTVASVVLTYDSQSVEGTTTIMTSNRSVSANLSLTLKSSKKMPGTVKLQFVKNDGTQVTANMSYNATASTWTGTANFTSSGTYTLKYVIMDGEYTELSSEYQNTLVIYSGITVSVDDGGEIYRNRTWDGNAYSVPMSVEIFDDSGAEMKYLSGVQLFYTRSGSNVDGMSPLLTWDTGEDCYTANLLIPGPGIYTFNAVTYGENTMRTTMGTPPRYTCISPDPPAYVDASPMLGMEYELSTGSTADTIRVGVRIAHAEGATVTATLYDADTMREFTAAATADNTVDIDGVPVSTFYFTLPKIDGTHQSGDWTITKLELANVYDKDTNFYDETNPMVMTPKTCDHNGHTANECVYDLHIKVVHVVMTLVTVKSDGSNTDPAVLSETLNGGSFMGTATTQNRIAVKLTDHKGNALNTEYITVSEMKLTYGYVAGTSQTHGGYTSDAEANLADIELTLTRGADGITYTASTFTLAYAGEYTGKSLAFTVSDKDGTSKSFSHTSKDRDAYNGISMPKYILQTTFPTIAITAISLTGTFDVDTTSNADSSHTSATVPAFTSTYATVYFKCAREGSGTTCSPYRHNYTRPSVTIKVSGMGKATQATLSFGSEIYMYNGTTQTNAYTWSADGTASRNIGYYNSRSAATDDKTGAGTLTADKLVFTYNGVEYNFAISTITDASVITIYNPY